MVIKKIKIRIRNRKYIQKRKTIYLRKTKHSLYLAKQWAKKFEKRTKKRESKEYLEKIKEKLRENNIPKPRHGLVYMKFGRRSFHLGLSKKTKIKNKSRFSSKTQKKKGFALKMKKTIGQLHMYKGRARSSAIARKNLAIVFVKELITHNVHIVDLSLKSEMGKHYFSVTGAFAQKNLVIRSVTRLVSRPHGYMRKKKQRRT